MVVSTSNRANCRGFSVHRAVTGASLTMNLGRGRENKYESPSSMDNVEIGVRITFLAFEAIYCSWLAETPRSPLKLERGCLCKRGMFYESTLAPHKSAESSVTELFLAADVRKQLKPRRPSKSVPEGQTQGGQSLGCVLVLNKGFAFGSL